MKSLFSSFPNTNLTEWKDKVIKDLKGVTFEELSFIDENGIKVAPFYNNENQIGVSNLQFQNPEWEICSLIEVVDSKAANQDALFALNNGASGLIFQFRQEDQFNLSNLLKDIKIEFLYISFKIKKNISGFRSKLFHYLKNQNLELKDIQLFIDYDPISELLKSEKSQHMEIANYCAVLKAEKRNNSISIDSTIYQNAGLNSTTQLALGLAHLNEYLTILEENKLLKQIQKVNLKIAVATDFFEEIAKMRAARIVFANLFKFYNIDISLIISAESSDIYRTNLDLYNNIIRDSLSGMAAVFGGCDNLYIYDFDQNKNDKRSFGERIARNQQLIFKEESYLNHVADIASGSYYLETLTHEIGKKSWSIFQEIEQKGGLIAYFESGEMLNITHQQAQQLIEEYKVGKRTLIGVNKHRNPLDEEISFSIQETRTNGLRKLNIASALSI